MKKEILNLIEKIDPEKNNTYTLSEIIDKTGKKIIDYRANIVKKYCIIDNILNPYLEISLYKELVRAAHYLDYSKIYTNILAKPLGEKGIELQKSFFSIGSIRRQNKLQTLEDLETKLKEIKSYEDAGDVFSCFLYTVVINENNHELEKFLGLYNLDQNVRTVLLNLARTADWNIITRTEDRYRFPEGITERYLIKKLKEKKLYIYLN
ncbi:MAG: hypothetical protein QXK76_01820 [Candidatus Woesearchaeota archaeon]